MTLKYDRVLTFGEVKGLVGKALNSNIKLEFEEIFNYDKSATIADVDSYKTATFLEGEGFKRM